MVVLGVASLGLAAPASAAPQEQSTPVLGLVSWGSNAVAESGVLTIGPVQLTITGEARTVPFTVHLELDDRGAQQPFLFLNDGDAACHRPSGSTSGLVLDCQYAVPVDGHGGVSNVTLAPHLTITAITAASMNYTGGGSVKLTVAGDVGGTLIGIRPVDLHRHAHLTAAVPGTISGHVGDVVDVPWTVTNTGPDELPGSKGQLTLTAPAGTEWTGPAAARCDPPVVPKSKYVCLAGVVLPPGSSLSETWQLKIVSNVVGTGHITAQITNPIPELPNLVITDPNEGQGSGAAIEVTVLSGPPATSTPTPAPSGSSREPLSPAPPAHASTSAATNAALPTTGTNLVAVVLAGLLAMIVGGILLVAARKRRTTSNT
ncbi:LPXTG cell wall anchor domain-containing protein [Dactylosporangium sp. CA-052675]|uniref:LPXTG cell wall anchor domain-containing protein n=1 Tax=Dactylosporangium sp. CA-052675 TaxID=3239927 RepID=UPI003D927BCB